MTEQQHPTSVQALVEAIDQRARQAGTEGATTVLRGLLGTVSDTLASIEARLAAIEELGGEPAAGPDVAMATIDERLQSLNARLGRLEEAFVRAVEDSSAGTVSISDRVVEAVTTFMDQRAAVTPPPAPAAPALDTDDLVTAIVARLGDARGDEQTEMKRVLEAAVAEQQGVVLGALQAAVAEQQGVVLGALQAAVAEQEGVVLGALQAAVAEQQQRAVTASETTAERWRTDQQQLHDAVRAVRQAVEVLAARLPSSAPAAVTPIDKGAFEKGVRTSLDRLAADLERLLRQEQSGRLVQLVEARMGAGLDAIVRRIEGVAEDLDGIQAQIEEGRGRTNELAEQLPALTREVRAMRDRIEAAHAETKTRIDGVHSRVEGLQAETMTRIDGVHSRVEQLADGVGGTLSSLMESSERATQATEGLEGRLGDRVRSEGEQLTQRVAALAAAVERLRQSVDVLAEESAQTLGRKATEVGRRLASDWGLRGRRSPAGDDDRGRELGPGR